MDETDLIRKARDGDMRAFGDLVRLHDRSVLTLAARFAGNAEDAKDIFQEVLINVYRGLPAFSFRSAFSTWLYRVTVNVCLSHAKRRQPGRYVPFHVTGADGQDGAPGPETFPSPDPGPDHAAVQADTAEQVRRALQDLSPRQRMVFTLHHDDGYSLKEVGLLLGCTEGTVKRYLFTATRRLRQQLGHLMRNDEKENG